MRTTIIAALAITAGIGCTDNADNSEVTNQPTTETEATAVSIEGGAPTANTSGNTPTGSITSRTRQEVEDVVAEALACIKRERRAIMSELSAEQPRQACLIAYEELSAETQREVKRRMDAGFNRAVNEALENPNRGELTESVAYDLILQGAEGAQRTP